MAGAGGAAAGTLVIALSFKWLPRQTAGWIGTLAIAVSFGYSIVAFVQLQSLSPEHRELTSSLWTIAERPGSMRARRSSSTRSRSS